MQIHFERTGGLAGLRVATTVDTETMPAEEADELRQLVGTARFFELPAALYAQTPGSDRFQYKLSVKTEDRQHTIEAGEGAVPEDLWPLLRRLTSLARSGRA